MRIANQHSHLGGYEWLMSHRPALWAEIEAAVQFVDADECRSKKTGQLGIAGPILYSTHALDCRLRERLAGSGWEAARPERLRPCNGVAGLPMLESSADEQKSEIESAGKRAIASYNQTDFVKERVAIEVQLGKYSFVAYDLFVKHLAFYVGDAIDLGIELLPMKTMQERMSSGIGYFEQALYMIARQGRGVPPVPLVLVGLEP